MTTGARAKGCFRAADGPVGAASGRRAGSKAGWQGENPPSLIARSCRHHGPLGLRRIVSGQLTLDFGWKRSTRSLRPLSVDVDAPVETVFDVIAEPYLGRNTHAMAEKLRVVERGVGHGARRALHRRRIKACRDPRDGALRATTPRQLPTGARPVPEVTETFFLSGERGITTLRYEGALGTDGGRLGAKWGALVAKRWEEAVETMVSVKKESERGAGRRSRSGRCGRYLSAQGKEDPSMGMDRTDRDEVFLEYTKSICPVCKAVVDRWHQ